MLNCLRNSIKVNVGPYQVISRTLITTENLVESSSNGKQLPVKNDTINSPSSSDSLSVSSMSVERLPHYDIVINGGGIVGLSFLLHLQSSKFLADRSVLLLESQPNRSPLNLGELVNQERILTNRVSSLTLASKRYLTQLGVWNLLEPFVKPTRSMHVWSNRYSRGITFTPQRISFMDNLIKDSQLTNEDYVCYVVENDIILSALRNRIQSDSIRFDSKLVGIEALPGDTTVELTLSDESRITTSLLIGCDGYNSFVRQSAEINYFNLDLNQSAIVGTVQISKESDLDENDVAYQRFVPHNKFILALLPLTNNFASFVLSVPRNQVNGLMEMSDEAFVNTLNEALFLEKSLQANQSILSFLTQTTDSIIEKILPLDSSSTIPRINPPQVMSLEPNSRASFPLKFGTTLPSMVGQIKGGDRQKCILIGDSAHRVHPLAGQGLNLGLGDAEILGQYLHDSLSIGEDIFSNNQHSCEQLNQVLYNVERQRQLKLIPMMTAIQTMQDLFTYLPSNVFTAFNKLNLIKNELVRFANSR
ncbi:ubiquinone biosynthesis monooxygenase COQ6, mitochondrial-like [Panonychus citri]|uniref:ubiquinone biosynthesis monooxygenase COQ6, mitochondrial-like n=1 Tax=Panonychus citri TaxID=50023 RepID=UPI002307048D|nr:ubiquinone biosynthesis monooxygenase COQ6, mitochondrial-like [Panonychus citri]